MSRERDKERYREFLRYRDANDCSFREWLRFRMSDWYIAMKEGREIDPWWYGL